MDLENWAQAAAVITVVLAGFGIQSRAIGKLDHKIDGVHDKLGHKIDGVHHKLGYRIDGVRDELGHKIDGIRDELGHKIGGVRDELRAEVRDGFARTEARLITLEQRTYDLSLRLPPAPASHNP